ncbi:MULTISPECIES: hypothetical protein [Pseudomonas fluorescens group]|uniref:hypothetical protein n=1 Tax=Pseudomonas fluorescens group TaxID=136843 RepID=UPI0013791E69|nr:MULTISPECIES: hypothetical protein [Pseudomonas fluorescens group]
MPQKKTKFRIPVKAFKNNDIASPLTKMPVPAKRNAAFRFTAKNKAAMFMP